MPFNNALRFKNLFGPSESFNQAVQPLPMRQSVPIEEEPDNRGLEQLYGMMENMPQRGRVGTRGKIGSFLMALGGRSPEDIDRTVQSKYHEGMEDFNARANPLLKGAQIESTQLDKRSLADYRNRQAGSGEVRATTGQVNATTRATDIAADNLRADKALELKRALGDRPETILRRSPGIKDQLIDKRTGAVIAEYPVGTLRDDEFEALKQANRAELIGMQGAVNQAIKATPSGDSPINKPLTPSANAQAIKNRAQALIRIEPAYKDVITFDAQGGIMIDDSLPPGAREMIVNYINGGEVPSVQPTIPPPSGVPMTGGGNPVNASPIGGNPPAKIKMMRDDGTTRMVSPEHVQIAIQQGFKQVQ